MERVNSREIRSSDADHPPGVHLLPNQRNRRLKILDWVARNTLRIFRMQTSVTCAQKGKICIINHRYRQSMKHSLIVLNEGCIVITRTHSQFDPPNCGQLENKCDNVLGDMILVSPPHCGEPENECDNMLGEMKER